jgi:very-short-patch-repair endonuclease
MRPKSVRALFRRVAGIAARQHGVISSTQLLAVGLSRRAISHWVAAGRLHRIHHGVYAVGHRAPSNEGRWMAAVLACGEGAVLSHRSAAELWEMLPARGGLVHVAVERGGGRRQRAGIRLHRSSSLPRTATTRRRGIPVTTPARTIADLPRVATKGEVRRAIRVAEYKGLPLGEVKTDRTRSDLERNLLRLCKRHRLPLPEVNVKIGPFTADFLWRAHKLVVETDGWAAHRGRQAFLEDRERDAYFRLRGLDVWRFSDEQVGRDASTVATLLRRRLIPRAGSVSDGIRPKRVPPQWRA